MGLQLTRYQLLILGVCVDTYSLCHTNWLYQIQKSWIKTSLLSVIAFMSAVLRLRETLHDKVIFVISKKLISV